MARWWWSRICLPALQGVKSSRLMNVSQGSVAASRQFSIRTSAFRESRFPRPAIDNRHLAHPLVPNFFVTDKISHERTYVDSAGLARVEDHASNWRWVHRKLCRFSFIDQSIRTYDSPFDGAVVLTDLGTKIICRVFVIRMRGQQQSSGSVPTVPKRVRVK